MKILLVAINAKYIHSNLAVYCLKSYAAKRGIEVELTEYTINHRRDDILMNIYQRKPDVVAFSCYIWNLEFVQDIAADLYKVLSRTPSQSLPLRGRLFVPGAGSGMPFPYPAQPH